MCNNSLKKILKKKRKGLYTPLNNKKLVIFIDDLSMSIRQSEDL